MASSVYSEVTAVSTNGYERDRVLDKLKTPESNLPYTVNDITISHNDFAISDVYNDSIRKLYSNYLYLIANAELHTNTAPTSSALNFISILSGGGGQGAVSAITTETSAFTHSNVLSGLQETHITTKTDNSDKFLCFNYSTDNSSIGELDSLITTFTTLLSGNEIEFNKRFKFKNVVSVDIKDNILFVLDKGANSVFKFDITGLITDDNALRRTDINDKNNPGRYLLKTIGGEGTSQSKNKLSRPTALSVYKNRIYILDNGHNSLKVFDLDFNFIQEISSPNLFNNPNTGSLVSIVVDQYSDTNEAVYGYILSSKGKIIEYDVDNNLLSQPQGLFNFYDTRLYTLSGLNENDSFKKIVNSKARKNIIYICNNGKIFKYYKSNLNQYITVLDLEINSSALRLVGDKYLNKDSHEVSGQQILSFDTTLYDDKDYIAVTTRVNNTDIDNQRAQTYIFHDSHTTTKLYSENLYTNFFSLSDILVLPQEVVSNITFNKTTKKLIYNHYSLFENLNKKVYSFYNTNPNFAAVPTLSSINAHSFSKPTSFNDDSNLYIGVNEPLLTDVVNRPLKLLYDQQKDLFNFIKEESLNNDPPDGISVRLPANTGSFPNIIKIGSVEGVSNVTEKTVTAGEQIEFVISRTNVLSSKPVCSVKYYTILDTTSEILSSDISFISEEDKSVLVFEDGEVNQSIFIDTIQWHSGENKKFTFALEENTNAIVDPDFSSADITITPLGNLYTISVSADSTISEGSKGRIKVMRKPIADQNDSSLIDPDVITSVNLKIDTAAPLLSTAYTPTVSSSTTKSVVNNTFVDFPGANTGNAQEVSAAEIASTSTIFFTDMITSVVFDVSAVNDLSENQPGGGIDIKISNPSDGSIIGSPHATMLFNQEYKTANLFISAISASYRADTTGNGQPDSNTLLSCVNVWEALSADSTFIAHSATNPFEINITLCKPLTCYSTSVLSGGIQFYPDHDLVYSSNKFNVNIEGCIGNPTLGEESAVVGMGGDGGHGAHWAPTAQANGGSAGGTDFSDTGNVSASLWVGQGGGPAIKFDSTYTTYISVNNTGLIYGGGGGGGGGRLPVSATSDGAIQFLSAGSGGGGGGGVVTSNRGAKGLAGLRHVNDTTDTQDGAFRHVFVNNGTMGGGNVGGGQGGEFSTFSHPDGGGVQVNTFPDIIGAGDHDIRVRYPSMNGLDGGAIGEAGGTDPYAVYGFMADGSTLAAPNANFSTISAEWGLRVGGSAGYLIEAGETPTQIVTGGNGFYKGRVDNIEIS